MATMIDSAENSSAMQLADACLDDDFADEEALNAQQPRVGQQMGTISDYGRPANTNYD